MSIFNRLISSLSDSSGPAAPSAKAAPAPAAVQEGEVQRRRFMGRDPDEVAVTPEPPKGLTRASTIWVHVRPNNQHLLLVPELGVAEGEEFSALMLEDLNHLGLCQEVAFQAGYDQYWKMPTQEALLRMPALYGIDMLPFNRVKLTTKLVRQGEPRGLWLQVRVREVSELPVPDEPLV